MAEILGKYSLFSFLPVTYTLTGANRQGRFTFDDTQAVLTMKAKNGVGVQSNGISVPFNNTLTINRARIVPRAANGLLASPNTLAGEFYLSLGIVDSGLFKYVDEIYLNFTQWGEWEFINKKMRPYENASLIDIQPVIFQMRMVNGRFFTCDDFNIQEDYVGEGVQAMLELDIETAGLYDITSKTLF